MDPRIVQDILRKLKSQRGCKVTDFTEWLPPGAELGDPEVPGESSYVPVDELQQLVRWELIEGYKNKRLVEADDINQASVWDITFYISPVAVKLENTLNISLTATPFFGEPQRSKTWPQLLMLMPFLPQMRPIFDDHVKKVATELNLSAGRADDFFSKGTVIRDIWSAIYYAKVIVADCTKRNPNVFYEIGMAHTLGKDTILVSQSVKDIPFDLRHIRFIVYAYTPKGMDEFERVLKSTIENIL